LKIAYCGYDFFHACLADLIESGHDILRVFSFASSAPIDSHAYVKMLSQSHDIPFDLDPISIDALEQLSALGCEVLITAGYPHKIPDLAQFGMRGLNVHPSLLPQGRGVWPLPWLILKELPYSGVSLHQLSPQWDSGDILLQGQFAISPRDNLESLSAKAQILATQLIHRCFQDFELCWRQARAQAPSDDYWPYPPAQARYIDWRLGVSQIDKICRAFGKAGSIADFDGHTWIIYDLVAWQAEHEHECGSVVHKTNTEMIIAASDGLCSLRYFERAPDP